MICDDGSPDDLEAALGGSRSEVRIVRKENGGISSAMNAATAAASGEFLVQLDQDDAFLPGRLEAITEAIAALPDVDMVATDAQIEYDGERVATLSELTPFGRDDQRTAILDCCFILWPAIRRSRLIAIGGYDESLPVMQDWDCFLRLILGGALATWVDEPLYRWRLTPGSRSSMDGVTNAEALVRIMTKALDNPCLRPDERPAVEESLAAQCRRLVLEQAHLAVETGGAGARRRSAELLFGKGFSASTRAKGGVAVLSPAIARAFIERRRERDPAADALTRRGFPRPGL